MWGWLGMYLPTDWRIHQRQALPWKQNPDPKISLDAAGLVALADLSTIATRTALTGTSCLLDAFVLCPGIHRQQSAPELNSGEYPACAAMTTGYVFRVENPATVVYLQKIGRTGQLTNVSVSPVEQFSRIPLALNIFMSFSNSSLISIAAYSAAVVITLSSLVLLALTENRWGLGVFLILMVARLCNIVVTRRRSEVGWTGAKEPSVKGDLLILLSQDRWIRMRGMVDDLKAVTSGQWLRDMTFLESSTTAIATVLVYVDAALASNVDQSGKIILLTVLIVSAGFLAVANEYTDKLQMKGKLVRIDGPRKVYDRRRTLAEELIAETGRRDWALRMGMIVPDQGAVSDKDLDGVTM